MFRNDRVWYHRKCDGTGKQILSMYAPNMDLKVYDYEYWKSDVWDPISYGFEYDFSEKFFEQFEKLFKTVPHSSLIQKNNVDSEYTNHTFKFQKLLFLCKRRHSGRLHISLLVLFAHQKLF